MEIQYPVSSPKTYFRQQRPKLTQKQVPKFSEKNLKIELKYSLVLSLPSINNFFFQ